MHNFIFDLDGTILNSSDEIILCLKKAIKKANCNIDESKLHADIIGPPLKQMISSIFTELTDEKIISAIVKNYRQIYDYDEADISFLYDGIFGFLKEIKAKNKNAFIATFKPLIPTMRIVKMFNLSDMITDVYCVDKYKKQMTKEDMIKEIIAKYNLNKDETIMIGDAASDVNAAKSAGVKSAGALWGYGNNAEFLKNNSDYAINHINELRNLL